MMAITKSELEALGYVHITGIKGLGYCGICPMIFTTAIMISLDEIGPSKGRICFDTYREAVAFLKDWDGKHGSVPAVGDKGVTAHKFNNLK